MTGLGLGAGGPTGIVGRALAWRPLRALGLVSYGVYLWHWPVIVYLTPERSGLDGVALDVLRVLVVWLLAAVSYRLVELPIRQGVLRQRRPALLTAGALTVVLGGVLLATWGTAVDPDTRVTTVPEDLGTAEWDQRILLVGDSGVRALGPAFAELGAERQARRGHLGRRGLHGRLPGGSSTPR